jgi:hypothetical protein
MTLNLAKRIDTRLEDFLARLPIRAFQDPGSPPPLPDQHNLAFRTLTRGSSMQLATGQQMAKLFRVNSLNREQILVGDGSVPLPGDPFDNAEFLAATPLWFYVLREAEINGGRLGPVGSGIVAETIHRAIEASSISILRDQTWRPTLPCPSGEFRMVDLLLFAFDGRAEVLNPLGDR